MVGGGRTSKHKHVLGEAWGLDHAEVGVLAGLALRGPQTPAELRTRTERMAGLATPEAVQDVLDRLAARPEPLVVRVGRRPGQKEERWAHLLAEEIAWPQGADAHGSAAAGLAASPGGIGGAAGRGGVAARVEELEEEVRSLSSDLELLRRQFDQLCEQLGVEPD